MTRLAATVDQLRGLRAARWIRESTAGQVDRFGPDAQREQQDRAIERFGLVDTGITWSVAHSGYRKTRAGTAAIATTAQWAEMAAAAGRDYDVLVVGYVSRFARDLEVLVSARRELHAAGAAILFADDGILTSDEEHWERWAREAVEAEAYSRRLGKRIREGYAAKRRRLADPGGRPPFGFRRDPATKLLEVDVDALPVVRRAFELAAARHPDRAVAAATGLPLFTVRGMLTSPLYAGRLRSGERARWAAPVPPELWEEVQAVRARRRTRDGQPAKRRPYALTQLHCAACGRHLIGDTGRYRHLAPCEAFVAAHRVPRDRVRGQHRATPGHSYRADEYEGIVVEVLERVALGADVVADVVAATRDPEPDRLALARVEREREAALARYRRDRDARALEATMAALDGQEAAARELAVPPALDAAEVVAYLRDLPRLWADAPDTRCALSEALFERIEVLGLRSMRIEPTVTAVRHGLAEAFASSFAGYGRGERLQPSANQLIRGVRVTLDAPPRRIRAVG